MGMVAVAAGMWATDIYFRGGLVAHLTALQIVFGEDLLLTLLSLTWLLSTISNLRRLTPEAWIAAVVIGVGPQAVATVLFTASLSYGAFAETYLLQQLQPLVAIILASFILHERRTMRFWLGAVVALVGVYFVVFGADAAGPFAAIVRPHLIAGCLAISAAILWAAGTVMGRRLLASTDYVTTTSLRFAVALPVLAIALALTRGPHALVGYDTSVLPLLIGLAVVPGALAMLLYYRGLRGAPASVATLAELAFPAIATLIATLPKPVGFAQQWTPLQIIGTILLGGAVATLARRLSQVVVVYGGGRSPRPAAEAPVREVPGVVS